MVMSLWKKQSLALVALAAAATLPVMTETAAQTVAQSAPVVKSGNVQAMKLSAHVLKPGMLVKNDAKLASNHKLSIKGKTATVNNDQLAAFNALPDDLKGKFGPPVNGDVLGVDEIKKIQEKLSSTVMCPW
jgi:hypothetical protein